MERPRKKLVFENGRVFAGEGFGADADAVCEAVFNTSMVGYQEIFSDPSYCGQFVCMTYPLIGNYGLAADDYETKTPRIGGFIVREYNDSLSNFRAARTLSEVIEEYGVPGIAGPDTRAITRMLRSEGSMRALLTDADTPDAAALEQLAGTPVPRDQVARASCKKPWRYRTANARYSVVAVDCGVKHNIIRSLAARGCDVTVVPYDTPAKAVLAMEPDGLFLSNGPGDPRDVPEAAALVRALQGRLPIFGICLGHQLIALANGARTYQLKFGHRGGNHPVKNLLTGRIEITSQNHSFAVDPESLSGTGLTVTHQNLLDGTVEGLENAAQRIFSVQYHPESAPGPQDSAYLFDKFIASIEAFLTERGDRDAEAY
ncbi:glutamine-hydrolyzing carbamoyl-phosphate synthase small subunit [uncultured Anaerotruncus sp.]|uniref:glutamine-hydrolyzing carbamoyl-phosphate synthase small subunit n=1 Tax=uncultured Anaerotruncus sp. TaxID=905011 RepID=UPI00266EC88B|nr:glutamine-hydrolyzing carbamoyl-phosphate synthase small subunit [uncultured Anaerotruncus sp.]